MNKPQASANEFSLPFWQGLNEQQVTIQKCQNAACGKVVFYPRVCCPHCHGDQLEWIRVSGKGTVLSHTTVHRPHHPGFDAEAPYVFAAIELDEGAMLYAQILNAPTQRSASLLGRAVNPIFQDHPGGQGATRTLLAFELAD